MRSEVGPSWLDEGGELQCVADTSDLFPKLRPFLLMLGSEVTGDVLPRNWTETKLSILIPSGASGERSRG